ncbi:uncharacterized protein G2W53_023574 [Senna tora]|uniref:Uncharacterized protein n=1 Tax=Senna tora TaxID=362788 RepID=A0A834WIC0_9FABA|nr:uncharacterized protein G2W53_023574 [Senna tora]
MTCQFIDDDGTGGAIDIMENNGLLEFGFESSSRREVGGGKT